MGNIERYYGKYIRIVEINGKEYTGKADFYEPPQDNDGQECIGISSEGRFWNEEDIESIEVIE